MKSRFYQNPHFQKWTLFSMLVLSLGFNLSWNPQMADLARHQSQSLDLALTDHAPGDNPESLTMSVRSATVAASTATNSHLRPQDDPAEQLYKVSLDLAKYTSDKIWDGLRLKLVHIDRDGKNIDYVLESTTDTECSVCGSFTYKSNSVIKETDKQSLIDVVFAIARDKRGSVAKMKTAKGEKEEKKDKTLKAKSGDLYNQCKNNDDEDLVDCITTALQETADACETNDKGKIKGDCKKKFTKQFSAFEKLMKNCTKPAVLAARIMRDEVDEIDCGEVHDSALSLLEFAPTASSLAKTTSYFETVSKIKYNKARKLQPMTLPIHQFNSIFNGYTSNIRSALLNNDYVKDPNAFAKSYYDNMAKLVPKILAPTALTETLPITELDFQDDNRESRSEITLQNRSTTNFRGFAPGTTPPPAPTVAPFSRTGSQQ